MALDSPLSAKDTATLAGNLRRVPRETCTGKTINNR